MTTTMVKVTIDDTVVEAESHETILDVCRRTGIADIPTLCYSPMLPPYGSCFVCVVEVEGVRSLQPSCATRVRDGMVIRTNNERVRKSRKMALELLLSAHWADCKGPCQVGCPAGVDAQGYLALAREGRFHEAVELIKRVNPLPIVCGRVCIRACEVVCERKHVEDPVGINFVKRYSAELERGDVFVPEVKPDIGKKVAIVGTGPAGLTCAYYLALEGVKCVLFDMWPEPGGMLRYGIPEYRLPKSLLDLEIGTITRLGPEIRTNQKLGRDISIEGLSDEYDSVFIAVGAPTGKGMRLEGEFETEGVLTGLDFLTRVEMGNPLKVHGRVVVVGGGNTAIDAARTSFRLGADEVIILYRRTRKEMPADDVEIHAAEEEGVKIHFLAAPTELLSENGRVTGIKAIRMELGEPDSSGRRRPVPIPDSEFTLECDFLFGAIGQGTDLSWTQEEDKTAEELERTKWDTFVVDERTMETNVTGVFAGGDVVTGPTVVIDAIAAGKRAATGILSYLETGKAVVPPEPFYSSKKALEEPTPEYYTHIEKKERSSMPEPDPEERKRSWDEAELGLEKEDVLYETERCLVCGCLDLGDCDLQRLATEYEADPSRFIGGLTKHKPDHSHPFVVLDNNKCILCGKCVSICRDLVGPAALGFVSRGFETTIQPTMGVTLRESPCIGCGNCIDECPTGALMDHLRYRKLREWSVTYVHSTCAHCGVGCDLVHASIRPGLSWIQTSGNTDDPSFGQLCELGRYGHRYDRSGERLLEPMIREDGVLRRASWDEALERASSYLKDGRAAIVGSGSLTMEEAFLLQRLGRDCLESKYVASAAQLLGATSEDSLDSIIGFTGSTIPVSALDNASLIIVMAADTAQIAPVIDFRIHRAKERGARIVSIGSRDVIGDLRSSLKLETRTPAPVMGALLKRLELGGAVDRDFLMRRCSGADRLEYAMKGISDRQLLAGTGVDTDQIEKAAELIREAGENVVAIADMQTCGADDLRALTVLMLSMGAVGTDGSGLILLRRDINDQGLPFAGLHPAFKPGRESSDSSLEDMIDAINRGDITTGLITGCDPASVSTGRKLLEHMKHIVVLDTMETETTKMADVVLPISAPCETAGHAINLERRIRRMTPMSISPAGHETCEVISNLMKEMGCTPPQQLEELTSEIEKIEGSSAVLDSREDGTPLSLFIERFITEDGRAPLEKPAAGSGEISTVGHTSTITRWVRTYLEKESKTCRCEL